MTKKLNLSLAIASSLGLLAQSAIATTNIDFYPGETKQVAKFASEIPANTANLTLKAANAFKIRIPVPNYNVNSSDLFFIKLALVGGAQFQSVPKIYCAVSAITTATTVNDETTVVIFDSVTALLMTQIIGAENSTKITYQLDIKDLIGSNGPMLTGKDNVTQLKLTEDFNATTPAGFGKGCVVTGLISFAGLDGLVTQELSARVEYKDGPDPVIDLYKTNLISFTPASKIKYDNANAKVSIDVAEGSKLFTTKSLISINTAYLGTVTYAPTTITPDDMPWNSTNGEPITVADIVGEDSTLIITGPALAAVAESNVSGVVNSGYIYLRPATSPTLSPKTYCVGEITNAEDKKQVTAASISFTLTKAQLITNAPFGLDVCLAVDGNNTIAEGQITAELTAGAAGLYVPATSGASNLVIVEKDGASAKVLNIPGPASGDKPFIRINNMSAQPGKVFGTLYNQDDGAVIGNANVEITSLEAYGVDIIDAGELAALVGVEGWPKRAWMQLDAELTKMAVQGLMRTPAGVLSNLSAGTVGE